MTVSRIALLAAAAAVASFALTSLADAHPHKKGWKNTYNGHKTKVAYRGDSVDGYHIPGYIFNYADRNNDGVLRGKELEIAVKRKIWEDSGNRHD